MRPNQILLFPLLTGIEFPQRNDPYRLSCDEVGGAGEWNRDLPCFSPDCYSLILVAKDEPGAVGRGAAAVPAQGPL